MHESSNPRRRNKKRPSRRELRIGSTAVNGTTRLQSYQVGALPLLNHYFERLGLRQLLRQHLPADDVRRTIASELLIQLLVGNVLVSREPLYGIPEWAARYAPHLFDLYHADIKLLQDDQLGRCLARLFTDTTPELLLAVVKSAIDNFGVSLEEIHNDSTTVRFHGEYATARGPKQKKGRQQPAITWGHSKDHRPDLKQLLFTLTLSDDGGVPVFFQLDSGNTNDDVTHRQTWDLLLTLIGSPDFLYVADCKLASAENLRHIAVRGGRFITVLPGGRREDTEFRQALRDSPHAIPWKTCWIRLEEPENPETPLPTESRPNDRIEVCEQEHVASDGYRLLWFRSARKLAHDREARSQRCQRAIQELQQLRERLLLPRTRFREQSQVEQAVSKILADRKVETLLNVVILKTEVESFRPMRRGRPTKNSKYRREVTTRFDITWHLNDRGWRDAEVDDGVFPLITNDRSLTPKEVLQAYKRQPKIEKRFTQLKSDYDVAPILLKSPERVVGLFTIYFLALLVQSLIERDLRAALADSGTKAAPEDRHDEGSIDIYPEGRRTRRPTARFVLDLLEDLRCHELTQGHQPRDAEPTILYDELNPTQVRLLTLLGIDPATYGK
jgi:transposase